MSQPATSPTPASFLTNYGVLVEGLRLAGVGVWRWKIGSSQLEWTRNLESVHGLPPSSFDGTIESFQRDIHQDDAAEVWRRIAECIETLAPYQAAYRTAPRPGLPDIWIEATGGVSIGADGERYLTGVCRDVTARVRGERRLARRLSQQGAVAQFGTFALGEQDLQKILDMAVKVAAEEMGVPLTKVLQFAGSADNLLLRAGTGWSPGLVGRAEVGTEHASQAGYTLLVNEPVIVKDLTNETRFSGPRLLLDHKVRSGLSVVIPGLGSRPFGVFGIHTPELRDFDATDAEFIQSLANIVAGSARLAASADHHLLLVREMAHRAGNMLQLVNSIANLTFSTDMDTERARNSFGERLNAIGRANYVVSRGGWTSTRFAELVEEATRAFGDRIVVDGPDILLPPGLCFDMGLVLHELSTNSAKYGSLGEPEGVIHLIWGMRRTEREHIFSFSWNDPRTKPEKLMTGRGFGSKLITSLIERKWSGVVSREEAIHFKLLIEVPLAADPQVYSPPPNPAASTNGLRSGPDRLAAITPVASLGNQID